MSVNCMIFQIKNIGKIFKIKAQFVGIRLVLKGMKRWINWQRSEVPFIRVHGVGIDGRETAQHTALLQPASLVLPPCGKRAEQEHFEVHLSVLRIFDLQLARQV